MPVFRSVVSVLLRELFRSPCRPASLVVRPPDSRSHGESQGLHSPHLHPTLVTSANAEEFLADLLARRSAATAATRYKVLRVLYRWLEEEEDVPKPMAKIKLPPKAAPPSRRPAGHGWCASRD
jgi:integrase